MKKKAIAIALGITLATISFNTCLVEASGLSYNIYKKGMKNTEVELIQKALNKDGEYTYDKFTIYFGPITEAAVLDFQRKYGLKVDGIVGGQTINKMNQLGLFSNGYVLNAVLPSYKKGMNHEHIKLLQQALNKDGVFYNNKYTNYFGSITEKAVLDFQKKYGLYADGVIGQTTLSKMKELGLITYNNVESVSRGDINSRKFGDPLDWWTEVKDNIIHRGSVIKVKDFYTGQTFNVMVTYGTNHADVEGMTLEDTNIMKKIWGGFSWTRRPVLVYVGGRVIAASMSNMPHAGLDNQPEGKTVANRSCGYGTGYNLDKIKGNGMDGHVDLHFKNSRRHKDNKQDPKHQAAIKVSSGQVK